MLVRIEDAELAASSSTVRIIAQQATLCAEVRSVPLITDGAAPISRHIGSASNNPSFVHYLHSFHRPKSPLRALRRDAGPLLGPSSDSIPSHHACMCCLLFRCSAYTDANSSPPPPKQPKGYVKGP